MNLLTPLLTPTEYRKMLKKPHKYGVADVSGRTYDGRVYDSAREMVRAQELDLLKMDGTVQAWWNQYRVPLVVNGKTVCVYVADFRVLYPDSHYELEEVKGCETREWKLKHKLFRALYPKVKLVVLKGAADR